MGLLDPTLLGNLNKLKGLLGETPIGKYVRGQDQGVSVNGLKQALLGMPVFDQRAGEQDMAYAADAIGPQAIGLMGKIVYHGSPHKFDRFDASKIGTGEGAQAYGHGVYLADAEDVAKEYAAANAGRAAAKSGFLDSLPPGAQVDVMKIMDQKHRGPLARAQLERVKDRLSTEQYEAVVREFDAGGALYKADLPDEWIPKMLDWDKPLSEQSKEVREAFLKAQAGGDKLLSELLDLSPSGMQLQGMIPTAHGAAAYKTMAEQMGGHAKAANALRQAGIPGIRYLDGGSRPNSGRITMLEQTIANLQSRGASKAAITNAQRELDAELARASYNYVVFPGLEDQVKILERNGIPINDGLLGRK